MPINVEGPGGESIEFPDGTDHDTILAAMKKHFGGPEEKPSGIKELGKGLARGVTGTLGSLGEAITGKGLREGLQIPENPKFTPHYADRMNKALGLEAQGDTLAGDVGEAVANPLNLLGGGSAALKIGGAAMGGAGSHYGRKVAEELGAPEWGQTLASVAGGVAGGAGSGATSKAMREAAGRKALADAPAVKAGSRASYQIIENDNTLIPTAITDGLHTKITSLLGHKYDKMNAPETLGVLDFYLKDRAKPAKFIDLVNMSERLGEINPTNGKDLYAGSLVKDEINSWIGQTSGKVGQAMKDAVNDWNVGSQVEALEKAKELGIDQASVTGWKGNVQNAELQKLNSILKNDKKLSRLKPEEQQALKDVVRGTFMSRTARSIDKAVPHGLLPLIGMASFPAAVGLAGAKTAFRKLGEHLTDQQIENLIAKVQERATINRAQAVRNYDMRIDAKKAMRDQALRSGVEGVQQAIEHQGDEYDQLNSAQP